MIPKRLMWMAIGASATRVVKWRAERAVDGATDRLEAQLPPSVRRVAEVLPGDVLRAGGTVVASGQAARTAVKLSRTGAVVAGRAANRTTATVVQGRRVVRRSRRAVEGALVGTAADWRRATDEEARRLRSAYLRETEGVAAATDALLDRRGDRSLTSGHDRPLPPTPPPVPAGRRRFRAPLPEPPVARVQRTYRRSRTRW